MQVILFVSNAVFSPREVNAFRALFEEFYFFSVSNTGSFLNSGR